MTAGRSLLDGVKVLDLTPNIVGKYATQLLADLGADVLNVARPVELEADGETVTVGRNKRSIALDLKDDRGRLILQDLIARSDVLVEGFRPGVAGRLGFGVAEARQQNSTLVYCSLSGYGQSGPYADRPGHDLNYQGVAGSVLLDDSNRPRLPETNMSDRTASINVVLAVLAGLLRRERTGEGAELDVALLDAAAMLPAAESFGHAEYRRVFNGGPPGSEAPPSRIASTEAGEYPCYQIYECSDGCYLSLCAVEPQFWAALCETFECPDWIDRQFSGGAVRSEMFDVIRQRFRTRPREEWLGLLGALGLPVAPVHIGLAAVDDPQVAHRGTFVRADLPNGQSMWQIAPPFRSPQLQFALSRPLTAAGQDTRAVLAALGRSADEIERLMSDGIACEAAK